MCLCCGVVKCVRKREKIYNLEGGGFNLPAHNAHAIAVVLFRFEFGKCQLFHVQ